MKAILNRDIIINIGKSAFFGEYSAEIGHQTETSDFVELDEEFVEQQQ